jgi:hypothetical protein
MEAWHKEMPPSRLFLRRAEPTSSLTSSLSPLLTSPLVARCCLQLRPSLPSFNLIFVLVFEFHHSFMGIIYLSRAPEGIFRQDIWTCVGHELSFSGRAWVELCLHTLQKLTLVVKTLGFIHWSSMSLLLTVHWLIFTALDILYMNALIMASLHEQRKLTIYVAISINFEH